MAIDEERELSDAYRTSQRAPRPRGQGLNDLYIRFFRMAERQIVEQTGRGVVCFISNYSWLDGLSFPGMRERYLGLFDSIQIDSLNGDRYRTGKLTPEGLPDPSVFSTSFNREGIQVGTAIATLTRTGPVTEPSRVSFRNLWGRDKLEQLATADFEALPDKYEQIEPVLEMGFPFMPSETEASYFNWPLLSDLFPVSFPGVKTSRDDFLVDVDKPKLEARIGQYFDPAVSDTEIAQSYRNIMESTKRYDANVIRNYLQRRGLLRNNFVRYLYRPFDLRWLYWEPETKLLDEKRSDYFQQTLGIGHNPCIAAVQQNRKAFDPPVVTTELSSLHVVERGANLFPLYLKGNAGNLFESVVPNLSDRAKAYLTTLSAEPDALFYHTVATVHAPDYRTENSSALRQDWPRIVLPDSLEALGVSAELGRTVAALLDTEKGVPGVTSGSVRAELRGVGTISVTDGGSVNPDAGDLTVTNNWGYRNPRGAIMPGSGRVVARPYTDAEMQALETGAAALGMRLEQVLAQLGPTTFDVYLNGRAYWRNVPERVWGYTIGGYQVVKKWLSYREEGVLGRALTADEAREVMNMTRRIAALLLLTPQLDTNYQLMKGTAY